MSALWRAGAPVEAPCGGMGTCGKCRVRVLGGNLTPPTRREVESLGPTLGEGYRLSCMAFGAADGEAVVEVPSAAGAGFAAVGLEPPTRLDPPVRVARLHVGRPSLEDQTPPDRRLLDMGVSLDCLPALRDLASSAGCGDLYAALWEGSAVALSCSEMPALGLAIDVGTTKVAVQLVDMSTGTTVASTAVPNPQRAYGVDLVSRLRHVVEDPDALWAMRDALLDAVNRAVEELGGAGATAVSVVGNTAMTHIFLGVDPTPLAYSPYVPPASLGGVYRAGELGLAARPCAPVYVFPGVTGFVGGDAVADLLTVYVAGYREPSLLIDLGTNTEVVLMLGDSMLAASAPAGSAIEGVGISRGVGPVVGAIDHVRGDLTYTTIGGAPPVGLTGTALVDLLAALLDRGALQPNGRLTGANAEVGGTRAFALADGVYITQRDVRLLQEAKAAVSATWRTLLDLAGISEWDLRGVYVAGSFGASLDVGSARRIGLVPRGGEVTFLGNAAVVGAKLVLRNRALWERAREIARRVRVVETAVLDGFRRRFIEELSFPAD